MKPITKREVMSLIAIILGIIFILRPEVAVWLLGILLVIYGIMELINRGLE
ncbi:MAG: hypothetical protein PHY59_04490 [Methanobacterium sp.]|nr:hypothetical protein [Methanobacterium sp.]